MASDEHYRRLERMYAAAAVNRYFAPTIHIGAGQAEVVIPVRPDFFHPLRAVHGAVYFKALDDAAFFAVNSLVEDVFVLTVSFTLYMTRPVSEGRLRAVGRVVHQSRSLYIAEAELFDEQDQPVGRGSGTFMRSTVTLAPEIGYQ